MKYFTKEWCFSDLDDYEIEERLKSYRDYIKNIYEKLPFVLKALASNINLHDGKLIKVFFIRSKNTLLLDGIFGDLQSGYYFLEIKYLGVSDLNAEVLTSVFKDQEVDILSNEIEFFSKKLFSHRILFSTKKDVNIQFKDIQISIRDAAPKNYKKSRCLFEVI